MTTDEKNVKDTNTAEEPQNKRAIIKDKIKTFFSKLVTAFDEALYPKDCTCDVCGAELVADTRVRLCSHCVDTLPFVGEHICQYCGMPLKDESDYCNRCQYSRQEFSKNRAPLVYDGDVKRLIYAFKFNQKKYIAETLGALMSDEYLKRGMDADIIVFVPMAKAEEKKRGYNQSELLANEVGKRLNMPVLPALVKIRSTSAQKELKGKDRATNLEGAFACVFEQVKNRRILLIDDIFTTGATANECAKVLLKAKARDVSVLTSAITMLKIPVESNDGQDSI